MIWNLKLIKFWDSLKIDRWFKYTQKNLYTEGLKALFQRFTVWYGSSVVFFVIITHLCCTRVCYYHQKPTLEPYHMVNLWNEAFNTFLPRLFVKLFIIFFPLQQFVMALQNLSHLLM